MDANSRIWAVVPAAGVGKRMRSNRPKQYLDFCGKTVIEHTLDRLLACDRVVGVIIALSPDDAYWSGLDYRSDKPLVRVEGGAERQDSVVNALDELTRIEPGPSAALVHDAVRPLITREDLTALIDAFGKTDAGAILATPVVDTLKRGDESDRITATEDRTGLWRALTPQLFDTVLLLEAIRRADASGSRLTDDSAAIEAMGYRPLLVQGSPQNIKITRPEDMALAELIWRSQQA